jgi:hypothetical protein
MKIRTTALLGLVLLAGLVAASLLFQSSGKLDPQAASNGSTALNLVKLPSSSGGVSVGLTKLSPGNGK